MDLNIARKARVVVTVALCGFISAVSAQMFPGTIPLPPGWRPEGIASGRGQVLYSGSLATGAIYSVNPRTGTGEMLSPGMSGHVAVGLAFDRRTNLLYVAGGATGQARVIDTASGAVIAAYQLSSTAPSFINDVVVTQNAVYFTNSTQAVIYQIPLGHGGRPDPMATAAMIPLSGDWQQVAGFNANGIVATPQGQLLLVNSSLGTLYRVDPTTGVAALVNLGSASLSAGDGMLLEGQTLYVVRNRLNQVVVIELEADFASGVVAETITNAAFDVPTTLARVGSALYTVNARFSTPPEPTTTYDIVRVR